MKKGEARNLRLLAEFEAEPQSSPSSPIILESSKKINPVRQENA